MSGNKFPIVYEDENVSASDVELEIVYYNSKAIKEENPQAALDYLQQAIDIQDNGDSYWILKSLKQIVKLHFKLEDYAEAMQKYKKLLLYVNQFVAHEFSEKAVKSIMNCSLFSKNMNVVREFHEITLHVLKQPNEQFWFDINMKVGEAYLQNGEFEKLGDILNALYQTRELKGRKDSVSKELKLLQIYTLEIQMHTQQQNDKLFKQIYERARKIKSLITYPLAMGIIYECGGKMHLRSEEYQKSHSDFIKAFNNYKEIGNPQCINCLKYLILANMLISTNNPMDWWEVRLYRFHQEVQIMEKFVTAYQNTDTLEFENVLTQNKETLLDDPFISKHIEELRRQIRIKALISLIGPYKTIKLPFISKALNMNDDDTENLIVFCILEGKIHGQIDQVNQFLVMDSVKNMEMYEAIQQLADKIENATQTLNDKMG